MKPIAPNPAAKLWLFDFDNTLAALEREVDWPGSRRELEAFLRAEGVDEETFVEIPKGNLPLYAALHSRWLRDRVADSSRAHSPRDFVEVLPRRSSEIQTIGSRPPHNVADGFLPRGAAVLAIPRREVAETLLRRASEIIERHELIGAERATPTPGAIELLKALAGHGVVAMIVTSNSSRTVARWLQLHAISDLVRIVIGRDSLLALKPSPEMVLRALELAATPAVDAVFVGDSEADLGAARAAGVGFYGIAPHNSARDRLIAAGASEIFASPAVLSIHLKLNPSAPAAKT